MLVPLVIGKEQKIKIVSNLQHLCLRVLFLFSLVMTSAAERHSNRSWSVSLQMEIVMVDELCLGRAR